MCRGGVFFIRRTGLVILAEVSRRRRGRVSVDRDARDVGVESDVDAARGRSIRVAAIGLGHSLRGDVQGHGASGEHGRRGVGDFDGGSERRWRESKRDKAWTMRQPDCKGGIERVKKVRDATSRRLSPNHAAFSGLDAPETPMGRRYEGEEWSSCVARRRAGMMQHPGEESGKAWTEHQQRSEGSASASAWESRRRQQQTARCLVEGVGARQGEICICLGPRTGAFLACLDYCRKEEDEAATAATQSDTDSQEDHDSATLPGSSVVEYRPQTSPRYCTYPFPAVGQADGGDRRCITARVRLVSPIASAMPAHSRPCSEDRRTRPHTR